MSLSKEELLKNSRVVLTNYSRTPYELLDTTQKAKYSVAVGLSAETESAATDFKNTDISESKVELQIPGNRTLLFNNLNELFNAIDTLSVDELISRYTDEDTFWSRSNFPLDTLLKKLSPDYILEKVQFSDIDDQVDGLTCTLKDVISAWYEADPSSDDEDSDDEIEDSDYDDEDDETDDEDDYDYEDEDLDDDYSLSPSVAPHEYWKDKLLYQLREKSTNRIVSPVIDEADLPLAVYVSNQSGDKNSAIDDEYNDKKYWTTTSTDIKMLPVYKPEQITSYLNKESWLNHDPKINEPMDSRTTMDINYRPLVEDENILWTDYKTIGVNTQTGLRSSDFNSLTTTFYNNVFKNALDSGLKIYLYFAKENKRLRSSIDNARTDKNFENYINDNNIDDYSTAYFEVRDNSGKVLDTQIKQSDLCGFLLKYLWKE